MSEISVAPYAAAAPDAVAIPVQTAPTACITCGGPGVHAYCPRCGQPAARGRLTLRGIASSVVTDAFDINRGLFFTALELVRRPGAALRDYVAGRTVRYASPARYLVIVLALTTLVYLKIGIVTEMGSDFSAGMNEAGKNDPVVGPALVDSKAVNEFMTRYINLFLALAVPFLALASRLVFRRSGHNLAENLVFNTYVYAQQCLFFVLIAGGVHFGGLGGQSVWFPAYLLASTAYYAWAAQGFFGQRPLPGVLRSLGAVLLGYVFYFLTFMVVGIVWAIAAIASAGGLPPR
jgi:hypothetical protein